MNLENLPPNLPLDVRNRLMQSKEQSEDEQNKEQQFEDGEVGANQTEDEQPEKVEQPSDLSASELSDEDKTWKGRLEKEQKEKALLEAKVANYSFVQGKLLEEQERRKELEAKLHELEQNQAQAKPESKSSQQALSDEDKERLRDEMGEFAAAQYIALHEEMQQIKEKGFNNDVQALKAQIEQQQQAEMKKQRDIFGAEMVKQLPEFQGYVATNNQEFAIFLENTPVLGYASAKAKFADVFERADVSALPELRVLIDDFIASKQQEKKKNERVATAPPARGSTANSGGKRKATPKVKAEYEDAKRSGNRQKMVEILNEYDLN